MGLKKKKYDNTIKTSFVEIPEMINVDSRLITMHAYTDMLSKLSSTAQHTGVGAGTFTVTTGQRSLNAPKMTKRNVELQALLANTRLVSTPTLVDTGMVTESPNPMRNRAQQTEGLGMVSVAIQCNVEDDCDDAYWGEDTHNASSDQTAIEAETKQQFIDFAEKRTQTYSNGKLECLLCGEIVLSERDMHAHLAIHWAPGPPLLCCQCGMQCENEAQLERHACSTVSKRRRQNLRCPLINCGVVAISLLELYDHINEHSKSQLYRCLGCRRSFHTAGELRRHVPLRLPCLEMAKRQSMPYERFIAKSEGTYRLRVFPVYSFKRKRVIVRRILSTKCQRDEKFHSCPICLKHCSNEFMFANHRKRCIQNFVHRLKRKRVAALEV